MTSPSVPPRVCFPPQNRFTDVVLMDAFSTDARPALAGWRESHGLYPDSMSASAASGSQERIQPECVGGLQAGRGA